MDKLDKIIYKYLNEAKGHEYQPEYIKKYGYRGFDSNSIRQCPAEFMDLWPLFLDICWNRSTAAIKSDWKTGKFSCTFNRRKLTIDDKGREWRLQLSTTTKNPHVDLKIPKTMKFREIYDILIEKVYATKTRDATLK